MSKPIKPEIEITADMIEAGDDVLSEWFTRIRRPTDQQIFREAVRAIFLAMYRAKTHMSSALDDEKLFYERFWALHGDPMMVRIFAEFGAEPFRRSSVLEGFSQFLSDAMFSGRRCVEIGTWKGLTALVLARRFDEVISIDVVADNDRERIARFVGVKNVRFITVADNAEKARVIAGLDFDAAYIDGDHAHDTESDFALVERCGCVLIHEHWSAQPAVMALVGQLLLRRDGEIMAAGKFAAWRRYGPADPAL